MNEDLLTLYLQQIIEDIHKKIMAMDLTKDEEAALLKTEIQEQLKRFDVAAEEIVPSMIADEFFGGVAGANAALVDEAVDVSTALVLGAGGMVAQEFRKPVYLDALKNILDDTFIDLKAARRTAEMSALDTIDDTIANVKGAIAKGTIVGDPRKVIQKEVMDKFREGGLTSFVTEPDINGVRRRLPLDFYAMTVTRTKMREAAVTGATTRYTDAGKDLVKIYENADTCLICGRFRNMVVSLNGATPGFPVVGENGISLPPYHPNCRGSVTVWNMDRKTPEEIDEVNARNAAYDPNKDHRTPREKKLYDGEQKARRVANAEKKQFMAWNEELGADNFKTLGAFRRAKKANSPKFQELQSNFRSKRAGKAQPPMSAAEAAAAKAAAAKEKFHADRRAKNAADKAKREAAAERVRAAAAQNVDPILKPASAPKISKEVTGESWIKENIDPADYKKPDAYTMRKEGDRIFRELSPEDADAYRSYVGTGNSFTMNRFLYDGDYDKAKKAGDSEDYFSKRYIDQVDAWSGVIKKHTLPENMRTIRNIDSNFLERVMETVGLKKMEFNPGSKDFAGYLSAITGLKGVRYKNKSFTSASYDDQQNMFTDRPVRMELLSDKGQTGFITKNHSESEIVFDKDSEFEFQDFEVVKDGRGKNFLKVIARIIK